MTYRCRHFSFKKITPGLSASIHFRKSDYQKVNEALSDHMPCTWIDGTEDKCNEKVRKDNPWGPGPVKLVLSNTQF